jgi:hypothetical protein
MEVIELTGITGIDNIIHKFSGEHDIFKGNKLFDKTSFYISGHYRRIGVLIGDDSYYLDRWSKTSNGYTFCFKTHDSCSGIQITTTMYIIGLLMILICFIFNKMHFRGAGYLILFLTVVNLFVILYFIFINKDVALISINKEGIIFYKGYLFTKFKNLKRIFYSFDEFNIKLIKCHWIWLAEDATGFYSGIRHRHGFAIRLYIEKTPETPQYLIKEYHEEGQTIPDGFHNMFNTFKEKISNLLQFPVEFIEAESDPENRDYPYQEHILENLTVVPIEDN